MPPTADKVTAWQAWRQALPGAPCPTTVGERRRGGHDALAVWASVSRDVLRTQQHTLHDCRGLTADSRRTCHGSRVTKLTWPAGTVLVNTDAAGLAV